MKKIIAMVCVVMLMVTQLTGCAGMTEFFGDAVPYATSVVALKSDSALIKRQYEKIFDIVSSYQEKFSTEEWAQLQDIHFAFSEAALRVEDIIDNPAKVPTPAELRQMYELAYIGYTNAKEIIVNHKADFTSYQWAQLEVFDKQAVSYDKQVRAILDNPDTNDINMTLGIIITLSGAAYRYLLPVLVSVI